VIDEGISKEFVLRVLGSRFDEPCSSEEVLENLPNILDSIFPNPVKVDYDTAIKSELDDYFVKSITAVERVYNACSKHYRELNYGKVELRC